MIRPSAEHLDWGGPDLAIDNTRNLVNFYDQVAATAHQLDLVPEKDRGNVYREGQAVVAALHAFDLSAEIIDAYGQVRDAMAPLADGRDADDIDPQYFAEFLTDMLNRAGKGKDTNNGI
jgi:hypothetical protein